MSDARDDAAAETPSFERIDGPCLEAELDAEGYGVLPRLLSSAECAALRAHYADDVTFRKRIVMQQHGYGQGEYRYFTYPLPPLVAALRQGLYPLLQPVANRWCEALGEATRYPPALDDFLARCHSAGQRRPTPLLLKYGEGDYNRLHQDLYGSHVFPLQVAILLSAPGEDFEGGEVVLTEQRARTQSRAMVVPLVQGDAVVFPVRHRPEQGVRGPRRVTMRHGVSRVRAGQRFTLGLIFHDAE